ncbi:MAG: NADAR family protein [Planctomycetales bacterium]
MDELEQFTFFWDGPFSQWHGKDFELDGATYKCAEQYMMAEKARLFGDEDTLEMIMDADHPRDQKRLGRVVENFDADAWEEDEDNGRPCCWNMVWRGNMAKFSQNEHLLRRLLATAGTTLVEASPHDRIWGIGLRKNDPRAQNRAAWQGLNWLGEVLTSVREHLAADPTRHDSAAMLREIANKGL